jgi:hypothetical protein
LVAFSKFDSFVEGLANKNHNLGQDNLKIALTNSLPVRTNSILADISQISEGNGYVSGGKNVTITSSTQSGGVYSLVGSDVVFSASGGSISSFRYCVLYNNTTASKDLIGWFDNGQTVSLLDGQSFRIQFNSGCVLQLS